MISAEKGPGMGKSILYLNDAVEIGGGEKNLLSIINRLDQSCWKPIVTCPAKGSFSKILEERGIQIEFVKFPDWRKFKDFPLRMGTFWKLFNIVQRERVRIIHANSPPWFPVGWFVAKYFNVPTVVSVQGPLPPKRVRQFYLNRADLVVPISRDLESRVLKGGVAKERVQLIYSGIDCQDFAQRGMPDSFSSQRERYGIGENEFVMGCVANLAPYKGQDILLKAFKLVLEKCAAIHCMFVGRDTDVFGMEVKKMAKQVGIAHCTHFTGFQMDIRPFLETMDLVVLPSRSEGLGIVLLEAMAMHKPIVATQVGGIPEIIEDRVSGLLCPKEDPEALAQTILELIESPSLLAQIAEAGYQRAKSFSADNTSMTLFKEYEKLVGASFQK